MRHPIFGLLLTCIVFSASANRFTCQRLYFRGGLTAATAEDAPTASFSDKNPNSNPLTLSKRMATVPPRATETLSFPKKREDDAADSAPMFRTGETDEKERPSVAKRGRGEGRSLRQDDGLDDEAPESETPVLLESSFLTPVRPVFAGFPCSLGDQTIREHLNETTRTWRISRSLLDDVEDDIQVIVNCTKPSDVLSFSSKRRIRPSSRVVIAWPLTLTSTVDNSEVEEGVFPRSEVKAVFTCPNRRAGVFLVK